MTTKLMRKIIKIDEEKCTGCGACVTTCAEGALRIIDGKARLVSEKYCDGLGACLGECPEGALTIEERPAHEFDEEAVKQNMVPEERDELPCGCPSSTVRQFERRTEEPACACASAQVAEFERHADAGIPAVSHAESMLSHWPVQLALVPPSAPFLQGADLLLAADCVPFAYAGFHQDLLKGHALLVACPKLDDYEARLGKLTEILRHGGVKSLTVVHMEVPCCSGLAHMAEQAITASGKGIPFKEIIVGMRGELLQS